MIISTWLDQNIRISVLLYAIFCGVHQSLKFKGESDGATGKASPSTQSAQASLHLCFFAQKLLQALVWRFFVIHTILCLVAFRMWGNIPDAPSMSLTDGVNAWDFIVPFKGNFGSSQ